MHDNKIRDAGARALGLALAENTGLRFLSLSSNAVSNDGASGLAEGLRVNSNLRRLDLYFNQVRPVWCPRSAYEFDPDRIVGRGRTLREKDVPLCPLARAF